MIELLRVVAETVSAVASLLSAVVSLARLIGWPSKSMFEARAMSRRKKPRTPAQIAAELEANLLKGAMRRADERAAAKDPTRWGADGKTLVAQPNVEVVMEKGKRGVVQTAKRSDVFDRVLTAHDKHEFEAERMRAALAAIRRLESDFAERMGRTGGSSGIRVDEGARVPVSDRSLMAADRIKAVLSLVGLRDAALLRELIEPRQVMTSDERDRWRQVVVMFTGETHRNAQASAVRSACDNLALAYREIDHAPRRAA